MTTIQLEFRRVEEVYELFAAAVDSDCGQGNSAIGGCVPTLLIARADFDLEEALQCSAATDLIATQSNFAPTPNS